MARLELRPLRSFVAVAEELHFRRAAERLRLTQSALSQQIGLLEEQLGTRLFDRDRRGVSLTASGNTLLEGARELLQKADELEHRVRVGAGVEEPLLSLGYVDFLNLPFIAPCLRLLLSHYPEARISRHEMPPEKQLEAIRTGSLHVGIMRMPNGAMPAGLQSEALIEGRWMLVVPEDHALAALPQIPLERLRGERLILFARTLNPNLYDQLLQHCRDAGFEPNIVYETAQSHAASQLVAQGIGLFWASSYMLQDLPASVTPRPLAGFDTHLVVHAVWRADNQSSLLKTFLSLLRQHAPLAMQASEPQSQAG